MANYTIDPNMGFKNPTPSVDPGPDYANNISDALTTIGAHTHLGDGLTGPQIISASININGDLSFNTHNITNLRALRLANQSLPLSGVGDVGCLYESNNELWYNSGTGAQIQITLGGALDVGGLSNTIFTPLVVAGNHVILSTDNYVYFETNTSSTRTFTLPLANSVAHGRYYIIKDATGSAASNNITVNPSGSDTIDGASSISIVDNEGGIIIISNGGTQWHAFRIFRDDITLTSATIGTATVATGNITTGAITTGNITTGNITTANVSGVLSVGSTVAASGQIRVPNNTTILAARNAANTGDLNVISTDGSDNLLIASAGIGSTTIEATGQISLLSATVALEAGSDVYLDETTLHIRNASHTEAMQIVPSGSNPAQSGLIRLPNNVGVNARNAANTADVALLTIDGSNNVSIGDAVNGAILNLAAPTAVMVNTAPSLAFSSGISAPVISQADLTTVSGTGQALTVHAQNETGTTSTGGGLVLASGTGTTAAGNVTLKTGSAQQILIAPTAITIGTTATSLNLQSGGTNYITVASNAVGVGVSAGTNTLTGALAGTVRAVNSSFTIDTTTTDLIIDLDAATASFTVTLPAPTTGRTIIVRDATGHLSSNNVTILRHGTENINNVAASKVLSAAFGSWLITSDGTNWTIA